MTAPRNILASVTSVTSAAAALALAPGAGAQLFQEAQTPAAPPLRRIDAGLADRGPAGLSQRQMPLDQRLPTGFDNVYQINRWDPYAAPGRRESSYFARGSGGVTAIFPRSVYVGNGRGGLLPQIPPDTVFYIGKLPESFTAGPHTEPTHAPTWFDTHLDTSREAEEARAKSLPTSRPSESLSPRPARPERSIFDDEEMRRYRVARLLETALTGR